MEVKGTIVEVANTQQITDKYKKREFVLEIAENPQYPEQVKFQFSQDKVSLLDKYAAGQEVEISFNLKGRASVNKAGEKVYYNTLEAWRIALADGSNKPEGFALPTENPDDLGLPF